MLKKLRQLLGVEYDIDDNITSWKYDITVCHKCLSVWIALVAMFIPWQIHMVFALSQLVILLWAVIEWLPQRQIH
jgi:hypothetical protein